MITILEIWSTLEQLDGVDLRGAHVYRSVDGYSIALRWLKRDRKYAQAVAQDIGDGFCEMEYPRSVVRRWGLV